MADKTLADFAAYFYEVAGKVSPVEMRILIASWLEEEGHETPERAEKAALRAEKVAALPFSEGDPTKAAATPPLAGAPGSADWYPPPTEEKPRKRKKFFDLTNSAAEGEEA